MSEIKKTLFDKISEILKTVVWPIVLLIFLFVYHQEFRKVIDNSTKMSIGSFSVEVQREAADQGLSGLGRIITGLNEAELKLLLSMSQMANYGLVGRNNENYFLSEKTKNWKGLEKAGLVAFENFTVEQVEDYLVRLGARKIVVYYNKKGDSMKEKQQDYTEKSYIVELGSASISAHDKQQLESYTIRLSEKGRLAIDIILKTLSDSMSN